MLLKLRLLVFDLLLLLGFPQESWWDLVLPQPQPVLVEPQLGQARSLLPPPLCFLLQKQPPPWGQFWQLMYLLFVAFLFLRVPALLCLLPANASAQPQGRESVS